MDSYLRVAGEVCIFDSVCTVTIAAVVVSLLRCDVYTIGSCVIVCRCSCMGKWRWNVQHTCRSATAFGSLYIKFAMWFFGVCKFRVSWQMCTVLRVRKSNQMAEGCRSNVPLCVFSFLSASLYFSKRGAYWDRLCRDVVGRWLVVTRVHCTIQCQTVHPRPIVTMEH